MAALSQRGTEELQHKFATFLELQLAQRDPAPYFIDLKSPDRGPVPPAPPDVVELITHADVHAMQVMQGRQTAYNEFELKKYCKIQPTLLSHPPAPLQLPPRPQAPRLPQQPTSHQFRKPPLPPRHTQSLPPCDLLPPLLCQLSLLTKLFL